MAIRTVRPDEHPEFLAFCNAGMRPAGAETRVEDDFPVAFCLDNLHGLFGIRDEKGWVAGLSVLKRTLTTDDGAVAVAAIGSVVTRDDRRGDGLSSFLQTSVLGRLTAEGVALAVLWSDKPAIYAGRGFVAAGWEYHLDMTEAHLSDLGAIGRAEVRRAEPSDHVAIAMLYARHRLRTLREPGDDALLYGMPGTTGLVLAEGRDVRAYAFCGKGEDFRGYAAEWGGTTREVLAVLAEARRLGLASRVLVPAGCRELLDEALRRGAYCALWPCGLWKVLRPEAMPVADESTGFVGMDDPRAWLGYPGSDGRPVHGRVQVAVWGLDSV